PALSPPAPTTFDMPTLAPTRDSAPAAESPSNVPKPAEPAPPRPLDPLQPQGSVSPANEGTISILIPEGAQVVINGYITKSSGRVRRYVAQNLKPGLVYPFNIQVNVVRDGRTLTDSRQVNLTRGALEAVVFNFDESSVDRIARAW
ncbi:MAG: TIGR03000 domain-containing protein, partial [Thermoguttaceae bacterium]